MKLKTLMCSVLVFFIIARTSAQDTKSAVTTAFTAYMAALSSKDFKSAVEYLPADVIKIVPKEQMIEILEQTFNNPQMEVKFDLQKVFDIEDPVVLEAKSYAMFKYSAAMQLRIKQQPETTAEQQKKILNLTKQAFVASFGETNVKLDESTGWFEINATEKNVCAISVDGRTNWKFILLDPEQKPLYEKFLPEAIMKKIQQ